MYIHYSVILGIYWENGKENGNYRDYRVPIGFIMGCIYIYICIE